MRRAAGADEQARPDELPDILGETAQGRDRADDRDARGKDIFAREDVHEPGQRDADEDIGQHRRRAEHEAQCRVAEAEARLDPLRQHGEDGHVEEGEEGREDDDEERVEARFLRRPWQVGGGLCGVGMRLVFGPRHLGKDVHATSPIHDGRCCASLSETLLTPAPRTPPRRERRRALRPAPARRRPPAARPRSAA